MVTARVVTARVVTARVVTARCRRAGARAGGDPTLQSDGPELLNPVGGPAARLAAVPLYGPHQAGILTTPPPAACFAAFDVVAERRGDLRDLLRALTDARSC